MQNFLSQQIFLLSKFRGHSLFVATCLAVVFNCFLHTFLSLADAVLPIEVYIVSSQDWLAEACTCGAMLVVWRVIGPEEKGNAEPRKTTKAMSKSVKPVTISPARNSCKMIAAHVKNGSLDEAEAMLLDLSAPTIEVYSLVRDAWIRINNIDRAEKLSQRALTLGIKPDTVFFSSMINAHAQRHDVAGAKHWFEQLALWDLEPNEWCFSSMINACAKVGDLDAAISWLGRMLDARLKPEVIIFSCLLDACARVDDLDRGVQIFKAMLRSGVELNAIPYCCFARLYSIRGMYMKVENLFEHMQAQGIVMNEYCLNALLHAYALASPRQSERAAQAFRNAMADKIRINGKVMQTLRMATDTQLFHKLKRESQHLL